MTNEEKKELRSYLKESFIDLADNYSKYLKGAKSATYNSFYYLDIPEHARTEEIQLECIQSNFGAFKTINEVEIDLPETFSYLAISMDAHSLKHCKNPSDELKMFAVKIHGHAINYIQYPSKELQIAAVKERASSIGSILFEQCVEAQDIAMEQNPRVFKYIIRPTEKHFNLVYQYVSSCQNKFNADFNILISYIISDVNCPTQILWKLAMDLPHYKADIMQNPSYNNVASTVLEIMREVDSAQ